MRLLFLLLAGALAAPEAGNWLSGPNDAFYLIGRGQLSWGDAREYCLARNADLISVDDEGKLTWLLSHFMPSPRRPSDVVHAGLFRSVGPTWLWLNGHTHSENDTVKASEEHQCASLRVVDATWVGVHCDETPEATARFICERNEEKHIEQQKTENGLWSRLEALFEYFGIGGGKKNSIEVQTKSSESSTEVTILEDPGKLAEDIEHAEKMLNQEGSGVDSLLPIAGKEKSNEEGSGEELLRGSGEETTTVAWTEEAQTTETAEATVAEGERSTVVVEGESTVAVVEETSTTAAAEGVEKKSLDLPLTGEEEIEKDFNTDETLEALADEAPRKEDEDTVNCTTFASPTNKEDHLLKTLKMFLDRAAASDLQRLLDDDSKPFVDRLLRGITEANTREFGGVQPTEEQLGEAQRELLFEELSKVLVPNETHRKEATGSMADGV